MRIKMGALIRHIFILVALIHCVLTQDQPKSCADVYRNNISSASGEFTIYNNNGEPFKVFCVFHSGYGYTYISPDVNVDVDIDNLYTDASHVLIRDLRTNHFQYEATAGQITAFLNTPLSIQFNSYTGYQASPNSAMTPYVYIGFIPKASSQKGQTEGYRVNGQDFTFTNCDGNGNSYFAFFFNHNNVAATNIHPGTLYPLQTSWVDNVTLINHKEHLPETYFTFFELHFGGCGAYAVPDHLNEVTGATVGLRYDITCPTPANINHAVRVYNSTSIGSKVTYTCEIGYTWLKGDLSRTCDVTGRWTGQEPNCGDFPCDSRPCLNGGLCFEIAGADFECECMSGYGGKLCENAL